MDKISITRDADIHIPGDDNNYPVEIWIEEGAYRIIDHPWGHYIQLFATKPPTIHGVLLETVESLLDFANHQYASEYVEPLRRAVTNYVLQRDFDKELMDG